MNPLHPSPIWECENLGSLSSIFFFEIFFGRFFFEFFLQNFHKVLFLWLWVFLRECIFELSILIEKDSFFFVRVVFSEIVQFCSVE